MNSIPFETTTPTLQSTVTKFVSDLPNPKMTDLRDEQKTCHICMEPFTDGVLKELPVLLPCGHIFGKDCMIKWLSSNGDKSPRSCPMCRAELLPQLPSPSLEPWSDQFGGYERLRRPGDREGQWGGVVHLSGERDYGGDFLPPPLNMMLYEGELSLPLRRPSGRAAGEIVTRPISE